MVLGTGGMLTIAGDYPTRTVQAKRSGPAASRSLAGGLPGGDGADRVGHLADGPLVRLDEAVVGRSGRLAGPRRAGCAGRLAGTDRPAGFQRGVATDLGVEAAYVE